MPLASYMLMQPWNLCLAADKLLHDHPDSSFTKHEKRAWLDDGGRFRFDLRYEYEVTQSEDRTCQDLFLGCVCGPWSWNCVHKKKQLLISSENVWNVSFAQLSEKSSIKKQPLKSDDVIS